MQNEEKTKVDETIKVMKKKMDEVQSAMEKKGKADTKKAVQRSLVAQKEVNSRMYKAMSKQVPSKMRSVIKDALERLSSCKTD